MRTVILVGVAVVTAMAGLSSAQAFEELDAKISLPPMAKPAVRPVGYKWIALKDGDEEWFTTKIAENGGLEDWKTSNGCSYTRRADIFASSVKWSACTGFAEGSQEEKLNGEVWPLKVGKTWSADLTGINIRGGSFGTTKKCTVEAQVRVKVKAGEFDTYKVVCGDTWNTYTYYASPALGGNVYYVRSHTRRGTTKYELTKEEFPK